MNTPLFHLNLSAETDFAHLHSVCLQVAKWVGCDCLKQFSFAFSVVEKSSQYLQEPQKIEFALEEENGSLLKVTIKNKDTVRHTFEIALTERSKLGQLHLVAGNVLVQESGWRPGYEDLLRFNYALSHDLKNSLAKLKLAFSLLQEETIPGAIRYYFDIIHRSSAKLESTMVGLNKIIELGHTSSEVVGSVSPALVFEEVLDDYLESIPHLEKDFSGVDSINYIEIYLKSFYTNMLSNAVKYASADRPLSVKVKAWKEGEVVVLSFADNGQGIDLHLYGGKIFQPFTRFNNKTEGSGIGLYLIKNMVERNGGRVEVESEVNQGTTFRFYLCQY